MTQTWKQTTQYYFYGGSQESVHSAGCMTDSYGYMKFDISNALCFIILDSRVLFTQLWFHNKTLQSL